MKTVNNISGKRAGRPTGSSDARKHILQAAQLLFARKGLDQTTMRQIAAEAGVTSALVVHYFGSKQQLFVESIHPLLFAQESPRLLGAIADGTRETIGLRLAQAFVDMISDDKRRTLLLGILRSATSDEKAANALRDSVQNILLDEVEKNIPGPDSRLKATLVGAQLIGLIVIRYISKVEPLASATPEAIVKYLGPRLQAHFD